MNVLPDVAPTDDYFPWYQPLIYLPTGAVTGYELLARTYDARGNVTSAGALFDSDMLTAERKIAIDRQLRRAGLEHFRENPQAGFLSLNISPGWISRLGPTACSPTLQLIDEIGVDPARVVVEITETSGDIDRLRRAVKAYRAHGVRVAIDDFGAGDSQIDRVIALAPDLIKLDMRLFKMASRGCIPAGVLVGMMSIAERTGCEVVCEGVETEEEFHFGIECGARYMQGHIFSAARPLLVNADHFKSKSDGLLADYFTRKCTQQEQAIEQSRAIRTAVFSLCEQVRGGLSPDAHERRLLSGLGILRYFICATNGLQLSPNYELNPTEIVADTRFVGHNWSWRPYFPTLTAMRGRDAIDLVASTAYRDASTGNLCKTFGTFLDDSRVLLVDAAVADDTLHVG